jgi:hypothetical protein
MPPQGEPAESIESQLARRLSRLARDMSADQADLNAAILQSPPKNADLAKGAALLAQAIAAQSQLSDALASIQKS